MNTPEQLADNAITEALDEALGRARPKDVEDTVRSRIWQAIRDAEVTMAQRSDAEAGQ